MLVLLTLALICTAAASAGYGGESDSSSSEEHHHHHHRRCRKVDELTVDAPLTGDKPKLSPLERKGKTYTKLSCPNDKNEYALIAYKQGSTTTINGETVNDSILLSAGVNLDFVARCHGRRTYAEAANGEKIKLEKVACVKVTDNIPDTF
ncbi:unnamed protein product [Caenorhabditis brenneri]